MSLDTTGRDCPASAHAPCTEAMAFPRPGVTGLRGVRLSVPPTAAQPWSCSSALGFFQPHPPPRWVSFATPSPRAGCKAGARAAGVSMATSLLGAEDPDSHFSLASKAHLERSSAALEGWRVMHVRQRPPGHTAAVALFHTWPPRCLQCQVSLTGTADTALLCHNHAASLSWNNRFLQRR